MKIDLVLINGKIITIDPKDSISEAIAVSSGQIVKVGSNQEVKRYINQEVAVIDLENKVVTPGIVDVHCHFAMGGTSELYVLDIRYPKIKSITEVLKLIEDQIKKTPKGRWIQGRGWDEALFTEKRYITRWDLDPISPDNPVILYHTSGHYIAINTYALNLVGVTKSTPNPVGGTIDRDPISGDPTGVFKEFPAMELVRNKIPRRTIEELEEGIKRAQKLFLSEGVTTIKDAGVDDMTIQAYRNLQSRGELVMRIYMLYRVDSLNQTKKAIMHVTKGGNEHLRLGGFKIYLDGSGMARTAWMYDDWNKNYSDKDVGNRGYPVIPVEEFRKMVRAAHRAGFQIGVHTIGDRAIDETLNAYQAALKEVPREDMRHSIIHANIPTESALNRIVEMRNNIVIETQTSFIYFIGDNYAGNFGPERVRRVIPMRSYLERSINVGNSSDWSVCPFPPRFGLWAAIVRRTRKGLYGFQPFGTEESITVREALHTYTIMAAKCLFMEDQIGSIEEGKCADFVIWSADPYSVPTDKLKNLRVEMTIIGGKIVHQGLMP